jgi:hypothetical protein
MEDANEILIEALLDDVLDGDMLREAVDEGLKVLLADGPGDELGRLDATLATLDQERGRLVTAIATGGGDLPGLLDALRTRDRRREEIEAARAAVRSQRRLRSSDMARVRDELMTLAGSWRQVLSDDPTNARPIVSGLLKGRVTYTPLSFRKWELRGESSLFGLFSRGLSCCDGVPKGNPAQLRA